MLPPKKDWRDLKTAPRDGTVIVVFFHNYNLPTEALMYAFAQWLPPSKGGDCRWCHPNTPDRTQYADGWMTVAEFLAWCNAQPPVERFPKTIKPVVEFDL